MPEGFDARIEAVVDQILRMLGDPLGVTSAFRLATPSERDALELAGGRVQRPMGVHALEMPERVEQGGQIARVS